MLKNFKRLSLTAPLTIAMLLSLLLHVAVPSGIFVVLRSQKPEKSNADKLPLYVELTEQQVQSRPSLQGLHQSTQPAKNQARTEIKNHGEQRSGHPTLNLSPRFQNQLKEKALSAKPSPQTDGDVATNITMPGKGESTTSNQSQRLPPGSDPMLAIEAEGAGWSSAVQYANSMDVVFANENLGFFEALHRKVDSAFIYPEDFARQRIQGRVRFDIELGREGHIIRFRSSDSNDDLLHVYTMALLIQILKDPLPERSWLKTERAVVTFDFDYRIRIEGNPRHEFLVGARKNHLLFGREATIDPWLNEKLHEVFTHYIPPIIPLPGGFYVDFYLAYQYAKNLINGTPTEREAREARLEKLHQLLKHSVHRSEMTKPASPGS